MKDKVEGRDRSAVEIAALRRRIAELEAENASLRAPAAGGDRKAHDDTAVSMAAGTHAREHDCSGLIQNAFDAGCLTLDGLFKLVDPSDAHLLACEKAEPAFPRFVEEPRPADSELLTKALRVTRRKLDDALKIARMGQWEFDPRTRMFTFNDQYYSIHETTAAEAGGYRMTAEEFTRKYVHPRDSARVAEYIRQAIETTDPRMEFRAEGRILTADGAVRWVIVWFRVERDAQGRATKMSGLTQDITERRQAEEALRQSEKNYRDLVQNANSIILRWNRDGQVTFLNDFGQRLFGYSEEEILGRHVVGAIVPEKESSGRDLRDLMRDICANPKSFERNINENMRKDGSRVWVEWTNKTVFDEESRLVEIFSVGTDITERRRTENAIRHIVAGVSSEIGAEFFDSITTQFASILGADYTFVAERIEKAGAEFVRTLSLCVEGRISNAAEYPLAGSPCEIALRRGVYSHPSGVKKEFPLDEELAKLDVEAYVGVALTDSSGAQLGVMAALYRSPISDVEFAESILQIFAARAAAEIERKRVEEERVRLAAAIEHAGESILITDPVGRILYANPAYAQTTGYSIPETLGRVAAILRSSEQDQDLYGDLWPEIRKGNVWRGRFENRKKDGAIFQETATISPIKDATGKIVNYVMVGRDVTSEVMLQKQLFHSQKMEAVGALAGGIAHDFNNLLQAILGYAELLLMKKSAADPERAKLEVIQHAARDGADLVSRILTFSRKAESRMRPVDLNEEIRKALKLLKRMVPRMIDIQVVLDDALHIIDADPAQIEQALLNLAVNAHHAMPNGGRLLIETRNVTLGDEYRRNHWNAEPGKYVLLTVSDTGMGIKAENLDRIFEPFFTTKTDGQGTGLGLAMVYGIVSQHAGHIGCYSEPGIGTSFKIYFPVSESELIWDVAATREMPAFGVETILLVDDDARVREMGQEAIRLGGYTVLSARSGEEALQMYAARKQPIDLVILDLIMPGIGGKRCLEELLRMDPDVKALFVSGYSSGGAPLDDEHGGARGFLTKPYTTKDILIAIRTVLDRGRL